jgi:hypothetical protein
MHVTYFSIHPTVLINELINNRVINITGGCINCGRAIGLNTEKVRLASQMYRV